jgi:hypothetical protein
MEMNMFKLKFGLLPGHWGLAGKTREIAKAEYELTGYDLELKLLTLRQDELDIDDYKRKMADLELKYDRITEGHYHRCLADLIKDPIQKASAILELDHREGKIKDIDYSKQLATLKGEPWVTILSMDFNYKNSLEGSFELDWNEFFVKKLEDEGYAGPTPDNVVNQWFMEVCRNVAMEEFDGTGDFTADSEANLDAVKRWSSGVESIGKGRKGYK